MTEDPSTTLTKSEHDRAARVRRLAAVRAAAEIDLARLLPAHVRGASLVTALDGVPLPIPDAKELLRRSEHVKPVREGFSGADPYEIALRFAAGLVGPAHRPGDLRRGPGAHPDAGKGMTTTRGPA